jgi:hypothetical protein
MSNRQQTRVFSILHGFKPDVVHHGDCVGADAEFHLIAYQMGIKVELHPPINPALRAFCDQGPQAGNILKVWPEDEYLKRDKAIVRSSSLLIAAPLSNGKSQTGGTWATIRYAQRRKKDWIICFTNGDMEVSRGDLLSDPPSGPMELPFG